MDLISVIVPVYNVEKYLERCVDSIINQTHKHLEIILVDDGSPDNCPAICEELKNKDSRIKVIHKENGGLGFARNSGLELVTGDYVTFIDSDDWIEDTHIENLYNSAVSTNADVVIGGNTNINQNGVKSIKKVRLETGLYKCDEIFDNILLPLIGPDKDYPNDVQLESSCCMNLYKVDIIKSNNLSFISERYAVAEDLYFNIDYFNYIKTAVVTDEVGYYYFENSESISRKYNPKRFERTINFYYEVKKRTELYHFEDKIAYRLDRSYLTKIRVAIKHIVGSDLKLSQKLKEIKIIISHKLTREILDNYPIESFIPAIRIFIKAMKSNRPLRIYLLISIRENLKKITTARKVLAHLGIGK